MSRPTILCIGECMIELAPAEGDLYRRGFAGDTFNTAWYLQGRAPADVAYFTCIGTDAASDQLQDFVAQAGIATDHVRRVPDRTVGLYMISLSEGERSFSYWRGQSAAKLLARDADAMAQAFAAVDMLVFSGITLAILDEADRAALLDQVAKARAAGRTIVFDPNMRARLWPDTATMRDAIMAAAAVSDIILPSFDEDSETFGDATPQETVARYRDAGAQVVVVKNGAGPMTGWSKLEGDAQHIPDPVRDVRDTTAAGDSFNAGFISARLKGAGLAEAMAAGAALSAHVIRHPGALVA